MLRLTLKSNCYLNVKFSEYVMLIFTLTENSDTTFPIVYWLIRVKRLLEDACVCEFQVLPSTIVFSSGEIFVTKRDKALNFISRFLLRESTDDIIHKQLMLVAAR